MWKGRPWARESSWWWMPGSWAALVGCGHCVLCWAWNQLSVLAGASAQCRCDDMRNGCACPHSSACVRVFLGVSQSSQLQCGWLFLKVQFQSRGVPITQGQLHTAALSHHLATGKMHKCGAVPWSLESITQFLNCLFSLCILMGRGWKDFGCWHIKLHNLHFLVEVKAKENALNSVSVEPRNAVQGSVISWGMA